MLSTLKQLLPKGSPDHSRVLCGFNVFGYEEALAVIKAAENLSAPVILMVNKSMIEFMPPEISGPLLRTLAEKASVPVCVHLDHTTDLNLIDRALDAGFTSIMFDGSQLSFPENLARTLIARKKTDPYQASLEGEIGHVPYSDLGENRHTLTDPEQAGRFAQESAVDALAISVGNVHRLRVPEAQIDFNLLQAIEEKTTTPLVIHGFSGLQEKEIGLLLKTRVAKFNIGTRLRQVYGYQLRRMLGENPDLFDHVTISQGILDGMVKLAEEIFQLVGWGKGFDLN